MDVKLTSNLSENEISDNTIVEIDDRSDPSCDHIETSHSHKEDSPVVPLRPDAVVADCEHKETSKDDVNSATDCDDTNCEAELDEEDTNLYYCACCDVQCDNSKVYYIHTRGVMHTLNSGASAEQPKLEINADSDQGLGDQCKGDDGQGDEQEKEKIVTDESEDSAELWLKYKQESDTYYCEVCECSMNSAQTYEAHLEGARHRKNMKNRAVGAPIKKPRTKTAIGSHLAEVVDREPELMQMIKNCKEPLIGLQYVTEFCHTSPDFEPVYACNLCESKCDVRLIMKHITGFKHRLAYMKKHYIKSAVLVQHGLRKSNQTSEAESYAAEIEAKEGRQKMVVRLETDSSNDSAGLEPLDSVSSSALESHILKSASQKSDTSTEGRNFRKRQHDHGRSDSFREHKFSGHSQSPDWQRQGWGQSNERYEQEYYDQHEQNHDCDEQWQDYDDYDRCERDRPYPMHCRPNRVQYDRNATRVPDEYAYSSSELNPEVAEPPNAAVHFSEYRASRFFTNPHSIRPYRVSDLNAYPRPQVPCGRQLGFRSWRPPASMVPSVRPRVEAVGALPYHQLSMGANSTYSSANASEDSNEVEAISEVIADAIRQYKLQKAQEKT